MVVVWVAVLEVHLPEARSLKDKRRIIKGLVQKLHARWRVSIAETAFHDKHQRAEIGIAAVHSSPSHLNSIGDRIRETLDQVHGLQVTRWETDLLDEEGA